MASLYLLVQKGPGAGALHPLAGSQTLGRGTAADIVIVDESVSRVHAAVRVDGETAVVEDLDSSNGTRVNGEEISGAVRLTSGDRIGVGGAELEVRLESGDAATPTDPTIIRPPTS